MAIYSPVSVLEYKLAPVIQCVNTVHGGIYSYVLRMRAKMRVYELDNMEELHSCPRCGITIVVALRQDGEEG